MSDLGEFDNCAPILKSKSKNKTKKNKTEYVCSACGMTFPQWQGQCRECKAWNSLQEVVLQTTNSASINLPQSIAPTSARTALSAVDTVDCQRLSTGLAELDYVLGGGLVTDSVVLLGGDPGIGKSTLLLQALAHMAQHEKVLYVTGEESLSQVAMRAQRLGVDSNNLQLLAHNQLEAVLNEAATYQPRILVMDSIQTVLTETLTAAAGSVSQVRQCADALVRYAKSNAVAVLLVGHVTKEGHLAGPRVLEHMVDCVLYFEGQADHRFRAIRAIKNRFGAVNELGLFAMTETGLKTVSNPSALFLTHDKAHVPGSVIMATWEGSRPLLVEIQALVDSSHLPQPRRVAVGVDQQRLAMLLAIAHRHAGISMSDQDVFVNVVGGMRIQETGSDAAVLLAIVSSLKNKALPDKTVVFAELGLSGELRPVSGGQARLKEAAKLGFKRALVAKANVSTAEYPGLTVHAIESVSDLLQLAWDD